MDPNGGREGGGGRAINENVKESRRGDAENPTNLGGVKAKSQENFCHIGRVTFVKSL